MRRPGLAAYRTERYAEALRELRTVRRLNGSSEHLAIMADCERGLGRPERALALAQEPEAETLDAEAQIELAIVVSGARLDLGQAEAAVAALSTDAVRAGTGIVAIRVAQARATALEAAGLVDEAAAELAPYTQDQLDEAAGDVEPDEEFVAFDLSEFDAEGEYEDYPVEASGDPGTSERRGGRAGRRGRRRGRRARRGRGTSRRGRHGRRRRRGRRERRRTGADGADATDEVADAAGAVDGARGRRHADDDDEGDDTSADDEGEGDR